MPRIHDPLPLDALSAVDTLLTDDERLVRGSVRRFVRERYLPRAAELFASETFAHDLVPEVAALGLFGACLPADYGCAGMSTVAYGLALQELERGDSALRSLVSVQGSLAMQAIFAHGDEQQRRRWLPDMQRGARIGCFGLTEPDSGSDPGALQTRARPEGDGYVLDGTKMWITSAPIADLAVVWAKLEGGGAGADAIRGFVVERGTPGFETPRIEGKMSLRASPTGEIVLAGCRVPGDAMLAGARGLGAPLACLTEARLGVALGVLGAAKACYESAVDYARTRVQFGVPVASKQLVQERIVEMAAEIAKAEITTLHFARLKDRGGVTAQQVSLCKKNNVAVALAAARSARAILGANGILLDYPVIRHMLNLESVYTYEGTDEIHTLILGRALTGLDGF